MQRRSLTQSPRPIGNDNEENVRPGHGPASRRQQQNTGNSTAPPLCVRNTHRQLSEAARMVDEMTRWELSELLAFDEFHHPDRDTDYEYMNTMGVPELEPRVFSAVLLIDGTLLGTVIMRVVAELEAMDRNADFERTFVNVMLLSQWLTVWERYVEATATMPSPAPILRHGRPINGLREFVIIFREGLTTRHPENVLEIVARHQRCSDRILRVILYGLEHDLRVTRMEMRARQMRTMANVVRRRRAG